MVRVDLSTGRGQFLMPFAGGAGGMPRTVLQRAMAKRRLTPPGDVQHQPAAVAGRLLDGQAHYVGYVNSQPDRWLDGMLNALDPCWRSEASGGGLAATPSVH